MLQGRRLFKWCRNLPGVHCVARVQPVKAVLGPTCWALWCRGACCLSGVGTYLQGTVLQGSRLFKQCRSLPAGHCGAGEHAV